ncbi:MAG: alpha-galactosidase [Anaerolineales bacterium]|nr:alpha-galactosidase [Anaerolineales bacterium]
MKSRLIEKVKISVEKSRPAAGGGFRLTGSEVMVNLPYTPRQYYSHGWQSWSLTTWVDTSPSLPTMQPSILHPMQTDPLYVHETRPNGSWVAAVNIPESNDVLLLGALDLDAHVFLDGKTLRGSYESGKGEWLLLCGPEEKVFARYARHLASRFGRGRVKDPQRVWCSWYSLYTHISENRLERVLEDLGDLPFDVFQIDDGWQQAIGDWEPNRKFTSGMDTLAARIVATGRTPGLWLAPLLVVPSSRLYREHRNWLLSDDKGRPVSAGFNWAEPLYALDTTHPEALKWLADLLKKVRNWGYDYLKLDFLYAGALPGIRYNGMPREAAYRHGLESMRKAMGEAYFLACGAPVVPSLGLCDGMRIGPDVAEVWDNPRDSRQLANFTTPGVQNAIRTCLHRLWLKPLLHTDPDVVYFRTKMNALGIVEKRLLQELALVCGFKASSDLPAWLNDDETAALKAFLESDPKIKRNGRYAFRIDDRPVDFSPAIPLPDITLTDRLRGGLLGFLANRRPVLWALFRSGVRSQGRKISKEL